LAFRWHGKEKFDRPIFLRILPDTYQRIPRSHVDLLEGLGLNQDKPLTPEPLDDAARGAMAAWVEQYWDNVYGLLYRLSGNGSEAEDLTQEAFLRAAQRRNSFVAGTNLKAWLMRIATNAFLDGRRRRKVARAEALPEDGGMAPGDATAPDPLETQELGAALAAAMLELPETQRVVFLLRTREELSFKEIAATLETTEQNARWHMMQARRRLMDRLKDWI
jgi:RNA polymerase sigma-70 factor, ECF subfamily